MVGHNLHQTHLRELGLTQIPAYRVKVKGLRHYHLLRDDSHLWVSTHLIAKYTNLSDEMT